ncbi:hypothetical protein ABZ532_09835 [Streptomyces sp. NPDC019396]|uniref:hypothetical protein n=1 Tax=Streptomyces sp. NPDC019396 TaxID=3154687 RepID=UPI0033E3084A
MPDNGVPGNGAPDDRVPDPGPAELNRLRDRVAALESQQEKRTPRHRTRSFFAALLIVLGCVLAPFGVVAAWTADEIGDTDRYVATVAPLASDADVQQAAAARVTNAVMEHIDLGALLEEAAPADRPLLDKLIGQVGNSLEGAVRSFVQDKTQEILASDTFRTIWIDANRDAHAALVKALTGSADSTLTIHNNSVTVDLAPVIERVKQRLVDDGLTIASKIPEVHTDFTVLRSDDIGRVKTYFRLLQIAGVWLPVIAVLLVIAGVLLSRHRRRALVAGALGLAFAAVVLGVALTVFRVVYLNALPDSVSQPAAGTIYDTMTRYLRTMVRVTVALGVVVALAAWLSGPGHYATLVRQMWISGIAAVRATADRWGMRTGPVGPFVRRYRSWITWVLVAVALLVFILWSYPTGWVVIAIALVLLLAMAVVEFLAQDSAVGTGDTGADGPGPVRPPRTPSAP